MHLGSRALWLAAIVCGSVGILDAAISREWDLMAIFAVTTVLLVALWARQRVHRTPVTLRPDLAHWVAHRAAGSGEPFDDVLDRAVAAYKHGIVADETAE